MRLFFANVMKSFVEQYTYRQEQDKEFYFMSVHGGLAWIPFHLACMKRNLERSHKVVSLAFCSPPVD